VKPRPLTHGNSEFPASNHEADQGSVIQVAEVLRLSTKRSTLLRVPPFPLPHRTSISQRLRSKSRGSNFGQEEVEKKRPVSRRVSSIPPPLDLPPGYVQQMEEDSDAESDIFPEPALLQARQASQCPGRPAAVLGDYF